jgi:hypothetical protein
MTTVLKMNRNRQINLPSAFVAALSIGEENYFKADLCGNTITLIPVDPVERVFSLEDLQLAEEIYKHQKSSAKAVTPSWIKKTHQV